MFKHCQKCTELKSLEEYALRTKSPDGRQTWCKVCQARQRKVYYEAKKAAWYNQTILEQRRGRYQTDPIPKMLERARCRAKQHNVPFSLTRSDVVIPTCCPVLGIPLQVSQECAKANSPSLDRIRPDLGYVPDNVAVISHRANMIKSDATLSELQNVVEWLTKLTKC